MLEKVRIHIPIGILILYLTLSVDFRAMVDASMPLEYAKKHFTTELQTVIK